MGEIFNLVTCRVGSGRLLKIVASNHVSDVVFGFSSLAADGVIEGDITGCTILIFINTIHMFIMTVHHKSQIHNELRI